MLIRLRGTVAVLALATLGVSGLAVDLPLVGTEAALAGNGNGNGNGNSGNRGNRGNRGNGNSGNGNGNSSLAAATGGNGNGNGAIASELKWLNAAHASELAFANANPNSAVGRIAPYRQAAFATLDATAARDAFAASYDGRDIDSILADIDLLNPADYPDDASYQAAAAALADELEAALAFGDDLATLDDALTDATLLEDGAYTTMLDGQDTLSDAAYQALRAMLDLG